MKQQVTMVGTSPAIQAVEEEIDHAARSDAKVLITGESGVGKEVVARMIHDRSARGGGPLVTINCAGFPDSLLESELFGHVKGSFTDAHRDKRGWLEAAHGGTILMDEVGEMSLRMQALLLRFLETGEIQRVGSDRKLPPLDVRVITATHRKLVDRIEEKSFREDLYYRLNVIHIAVPALRERSEDVPPLLDHFLRMFSETHRMPLPSINGEAMRLLVAYHWPGNVRELRNVAERLVLKSRTGEVDVDTLPVEVRKDYRSTVLGPIAVVGGSKAGNVAPAPQVVPPHQVMYDRLTREGVSFWTEVYEPFMARDLTRAEVRELIRMGLEHTRGNYKLLVTTFNMPPEDYKKFLNFLRKYQCHVPFQRFRMMPAGQGGRTNEIVSA